MILKIFPLLLAVTSAMALQFTTAPSLTPVGAGLWTVSFAVSESTDVEVSIVDVRDSSVVRHLAAGVLGHNPPPPFAANTLSQTLTWNGRDDFGQVVADPESLSVRVRAGVTPRLSAFAGEQLYTFEYGRIGGILSEEDGSVIIMGNSYYTTYVRKYDANGNYVKTIYPPPAGLPTDSMTSFGINVLPGGGWAPKTTGILPPVMTNSFINSSSTWMVPIGGPDEIVLVKNLDAQIISKNGAYIGQKQMITTPPPADPNLRIGGPRYWTASHNPDYYYLSGFYYFFSGSSSGWLTEASDTGFWADGQVFRINRNTGEAASWLKLDSVPVTGSDRSSRILGWAQNVATLHGLAIDDSNHVFVCDRLHNRIGVYDTNAVLLGSVPCLGPDNVAVSRRTGAIYVINRTLRTISLYKFDGWRTPGAATDSILLQGNGVSEYTPAPVMALTEGYDATHILLSVNGAGILQYGNGGAGFVPEGKFDPGYQLGTFCGFNVERLVVDRATDKLFWLLPNFNGQGSLFSISDWSDPKVEVITGINKVTDIAVGPNGFLYARHWSGKDSWYNYPVRRYSQNGAPLDYANTPGDNKSTPSLYNEGCNQRGFAVDWQGNVAMMDERTSLFKYPDTGYADTAFKGTTVVTDDMRCDMNCVRLDPAGNVYVGGFVQNTDWLKTPGFETDAFFRQCGSVVKFTAGTTGRIAGAAYPNYLLGTSTASGAERVYPQPFGPFPSGCTCWNPRFDVDPYGRLFIPCAPTSRIAMVDNTGNTIADFGEYGNPDARGPLSGPGETYSNPAIPIAWPTSVAASEDYVYVGDVINGRIVRVKMDYALDNIPGLTDNRSASEKAKAWRALAMTCSPNPFNPSSAIRLSLPASGKMRLAVYSANGRLVREIAAGSFSGGAHAFTWNGDDAAGKKVSAGLYLYRLTAGNRVLTLKTVMVK